MKLNKKILISLAVFSILILIFLLIKINFSKKDNDDSMNSNDDEILVQIGEVYQKIKIDSGVVSQTSSVERGDFYDFSGLSKDNSSNFHQDLSIINSEDKNKIILASSVGSEEKENQKEFVCDISKKNCVKDEIIFSNYSIAGESLMNSSIWWLNWNSKSNALVGLMTNDVNVGNLYVCDIKNRLCNKNSKEDLNFPVGSINKSINKVVAIEQNDIANEKIGEKWELFVYNLDDLANPIKNYDISRAISEDEDLIYDGINSVAWSEDDKFIFIGTTRAIFRLDLEDGKIENIFDDLSTGEDDFYWNSDSLRLSESGRYLVFVDNIESDIEEAEDDSIEDDGIENSIKVIDLRDNNRVRELIQAKDIVIK